MSKIKLFTHTDLDGIGCAILAYLAFGRENVDIEYCDYGDINEKFRKFYYSHEFDKYDKVFITDISICDELAAKVDFDNEEQKVKLFDHHATAVGLNQFKWCIVCETLPNDSFYKTCGTELFYLYLDVRDLFKKHIERIQKNIAAFTYLVRDWDTWRWKYNGVNGIIAKHVNTLRDIYSRDEFIEWALYQIKRADVMNFPDFSVSDKIVLNLKQREINSYIDEKDTQLTVKTDKFGYTYGVLFAEKYFSEMGNTLCEKHPELDYIAMIDISNGRVSYRTVKGEINVGGEIAHAYGGGGHPKAAGSTFDKDQIQRTVHGLIFSDNQRNEL